MASGLLGRRRSGTEHVCQQEASAGVCVQLHHPLYLSRSFILRLKIVEAKWIDGGIDPPQVSEIDSLSLTESLW